MTTQEIESKKYNDFNIGLLIGNYIFQNDLPLLNILTLEFVPNNIVPISMGDQKKYEALDCVSDYEEYVKFLAYLEKKYLPEVVECHLPKVKFEYISELQEGIREAIIYSLWKSESCPYNMDPNSIEIVEMDTTLNIKIRRLN